MKSQVIAVIFSMLLIISPKVIVFSWIIAAYRWFSLILFSVLASLLFATHFKKLRRRKRIYSWKSKPDEERFPYLVAMKSTMLDMFGLRKNSANSAICLAVSSIMIMLMLTLSLPRSYNESMNLFGESNITSRNPDALNEGCVCIENKIETNLSYEHYFGKFICIKSGMQMEENKTSLHLNITCHDPIFFKKPPYSSLLPPNDFPVISSCLTFDKIRDMLLLDNTASWNSSNLFDLSSYDNSCKDLRGNQRIIPCSDQYVLYVTIGFSVMIVLMSFGLVIAMFNDFAFELFKGLAKIFFHQYSLLVYIVLILVGILILIDKYIPIYSSNLRG